MNEFKLMEELCVLADRAAVETEPALLVQQAMDAMDSCVHMQFTQASGDVFKAQLGFDEVQISVSPAATPGMITLTYARVGESHAAMMNRMASFKV